MPEPVDPALMPRAADIFLEVRGLGLAQREEAIHRYCDGNAPLRELVLLLLRGDQAPLRVESLADDVRAAHEAATIAGKPDAAQGSHVGRYRLLERIGEGGFGVVFAADQTEPVKRKVALKIIKLGMDTKQVVARFEAERQALAMMDHPNIAKVFDAGSTDTGRPYFVMELVRGIPITDYCDIRKLDIFARLNLFALVCDALQHAHQKGVIHRDIKPSNILVTESGEQAIPKVIDFGIAKATTAELTDKTVFTELRQMIGTPEYMSPEQAGISALDIDTRTDVYSLGVLLYELLTGSTPFESRRLRSAAYGEVQRIIREEDPPRPSTRLTQLETRANIAAARGTETARLGTVLRGELDWVVMKCLEKDRARRYDSAGALMRDIRRFIGGEAVQAVPPSTAYRLRKFVRKYRGPVVATSLLAFALIAGLVGTTLGFVNAEAQRKDAVSQKKRADDRTADALAAESLAKQSAYSANLLSAFTAYQSNQLSLARQFLSAAPESLRAWEWRMLSSRLDTSLRALPCSTPGWKAGLSPWEHALFPHPDGRSFFTIRTLDLDAVQQWDLAGNLIARFPRPSPIAGTPFTRATFMLNPDGSSLNSFIGTPDLSPSPIFAAWNLNGSYRIPPKTLPPIDNATGILLVTPDGSHVLRCGNQQLWLQDIASGAITAEGQGWPLYVSARISNDGSRIAISSDRGAIKVLDGRTLAPIADLTGNRNIVPAMDFSSDNRYLASACIDSSARIWDLTANPPTPRAIEHPNHVEGVCFSPDASLLATLCLDGAIRVFETTTGLLRGMYSSGNLIVRPLMFMPDGHSVAARERDGTVRFWDVTADSTVNLTHHQAITNGAYFADPVGLIVSAGWDGWRGHLGCLRISDADTGDEVASLGKPGEIAYHLSVSGTCAAASITPADTQWTPRENLRKARIEVLDLATCRHVRFMLPPDPSGAQAGVSALALAPAGAELAVGLPGQLAIYSAINGSLARNFPVNGKVSHIAWSPDGATLAFVLSDDGAGNADQCVLLDAATLAVKHRIDKSGYCVAFSLDGSQVLVGGRDGAVSFWSARDGRLMRTLPLHNQLISSLAFSPDGSRLATVGGDEGDIVLLNTATWDRVAQLHFDDFIPSAAWSADGKRLIGACGRTVRIWDDTPLRDRLQLHDARRAAVAALQPRIDALLAETGSPAQALQRLKSDSSLSPLQAKVGHQLLLKASLHN